MNTLILTLFCCIAALGLIFYFIGENTAWDSIDKSNDKFFNEDGDHAYYNRSLIEQKEDKKD